MLYFYCVLVLTLGFTDANSWLMAMPSTGQISSPEPQSETRDAGRLRFKCRHLPYLVTRQRELCALNQNMLYVINAGVYKGLSECQTQFSFRRWNCTALMNNASSGGVIGGKKPAVGRKTAAGSSFRQRDSPLVASGLDRNTVSVDSPTTDPFSGILAIKSREKAYVNAISAAGVVYSIAVACRQGKLSECMCDTKVHRRRLKHKIEGNWEWGGCSDNVAYAHRVGKEFMDSYEIGRRTPEPESKLMNLHNNEAGRRALRRNVKTNCKCHGLSGSCTLKICWRQLKDFNAIGKKLRNRFDRATHVKFSSNNYKLKPVNLFVRKPTKGDLVYLEESPDYCVKNVELGIMGTYGRQCNSSSLGIDGCQLMCCGRGFKSKIVRKTKSCGCSFVWCCQVKCDVCEYYETEAYCN